MPNWNQIYGEINPEKNPYDSVRHRYLSAFHALTGRNVLCYYSGWLEKPVPGASINDEDKNGFMSCFYQMDFSKGLDLFIHSPGGDVAATVSIINYIRAKFKDDVRVFVPQLSMSGGTMIALCGKEIWMGSHSNLGPIDPQFGHFPAQLVLPEFDRAYQEMKSDPQKASVWMPILSQIQPTFLTQCERAIEWSKQIGKKALITGMFAGDPDATSKAEQAVEFFTNISKTKNHSRHLHREECQKQAGLTICEFETNQDMQDAILSVHHANMLFLMNTAAVKIIENHNGISFIKNLA